MVSECLEPFVKKPDRPKITIEVELTSICAVSCPGCPRTYRDTDDPKWWWHKGDMSMEIFEQMLKTFDRKYYSFNLCGCYGDAIFHKNFLGCVDRLIEENFACTLVTSAANRPAKFWNEFVAKDLSKWNIIFSIDGIESNNHLYRRGARWQSIQTAVETVGKNYNRFRGLEWKHLVFPYNRDTVSQARAIAEANNFYFNPVESTRSEHIYDIKDSKDKHLWI